MALQSVQGGTFIPEVPVGSPNGTPAFGNLLIDAANEEAATILYAPFTGNLRKIHFRTGTVTTGATVDVRVETVDLATGDPSNTLFGTDTNGSVVIADTDDNVIKTATLTADAAVTKGSSLLGIAIVNPAASFGTINLSTIGFDNTNVRFPYQDHFVGTWNKGNSPLILGLEDDAGVFYNVSGLFFASSITAQGFNNGSTPDVWGVRFQVPFPCKVDGWWAVFAAATGADCAVKLYDSDGVTVIAQSDLDSNVRSAGSGGLLRGDFTNDEPTLAINTNYYLGFEPSTANNLTFYRFALPSAAAMRAWELGNNFHVASAKDPTGTGSWTHYNNVTDGFERTLCGIHVSYLDDGVGGGGGSTMFIPVE